MNLFSDFGLRGISMDYLEKNSLFVFNSKHVKPPFQTRSCLVKRNKAIRENGNAVVVFTQRQQPFAERGLVGRWLVIEDVVVVLRALLIESASIGPSQTLVDWGIEPDYSVESTLNKCLRWRLYRMWLNQQERLFCFYFSLNWLEFFQGTKAAESLFKQFCLGITAREVN